MKAIICPKYGPPSVLQLQEMEKPSPQFDEVLVQIHAASLNSRDVRIMRADPAVMRLIPGNLFRPKIKVLGADFAGVVEEAGVGISQFKPGDEVFGFMPTSTRRGTLTEYVCAKEYLVAKKPANLTFEQAAAVPLAALTALQSMRDYGRIQHGQKVLIYGASGGVGTYAVQLAKVFGAQVTAVCSTRNLEVVRSLGADQVIDYTAEDFTISGTQYDLILTINGYYPIRDFLRVLKPNGSYIVVGGSLKQIIQAGIKKSKDTTNGRQNIAIASLTPGQSDLWFLKDLLESGKLRPIIDAVYPLNETTQAFQYFEKVHPQGKVIISIGDKVSLRKVC